MKNNESYMRTKMLSIICITILVALNKMDFERQAGLTILVILELWIELIIVLAIFLGVK